MSKVLSIDLGTTFTKIAILESTGKPSIVLNAQGEMQTPTKLFISKNGDIQYGDDAIAEGYMEPEQLLSHFKLMLGGTDSLLNNGSVFTATDAMELYVKCILEHVESVLGFKIEECILTCPANFKDDQKLELMESCIRNGLKVLLLISEPAAVALAYGVDKMNHDAYILVYDFGGGTLDVSIAKVQGTQVTVVATEGISKLGGIDLTEVICQRSLDEVQKKTGNRPTREQVPMFFEELDRLSENAKISLGNRKNVRFPVANKGENIIIELEQSWFNEAIEPLIQQSLYTIDKALESAGLQYIDIERIILAGGTSRSPQVQKRVEQHTGKIPKRDIDPTTAIVFGAVYAGIAELHKQGRSTATEGYVLPPPSMFLSEVMSYTVGCCVLDTQDSAGELVNSEIIPKHTPIPYHKTAHFYLESETQRSVQIEILQGEAGALRDECLVIGELLLENLPPETNRTKRIRVDYSIDDNGMISVTAKDNVSGISKTISVNYKEGIQAKEKPAMV